MERSFRRVIRDVPMGSLLIQSDMKTGEPLLLHSKLPNAIRFRHLAKQTNVVLLDAQVSLFSRFPSYFTFYRWGQVQLHLWQFGFSWTTVCNRIE